MRLTGYTRARELLEEDARTALIGSQLRMAVGKVLAFGPAAFGPSALELTRARYVEWQANMARTGKP